MERFNVGQLTKELVVARLSEMGDPCVAAAEVMKRTLLLALKDRDSVGPITGEMISEICAGAMVGIMLREQSLPWGAVHILRKTGEVADDLHLDPTEVIRRALIGIAGIQRFVSAEQISDISFAIESEFMDTGKVFYEACCSVSAQAAVEDEAGANP